MVNTDGVCALDERHLAGCLELSKSARWNQNEADNLHEKPITHGGVDVRPLLAVQENEEFQEEIHIHSSGTHFCQSEYDVVVRSMRCGTDLMTKHLLADGTLNDDHGKAGKNTRHEEEDRNEFCVPKRMDFAFRHQEQRSEARLVEGRERDAKNDCPKRQAAQEFSDAFPS